MTCIYQNRDVMWIYRFIYYVDGSNSTVCAVQFQIAI